MTNGMRITFFDTPALSTDDALTTPLLLTRLQVRRGSATKKLLIGPGGAPVKDPTHRQDVSAGIATCVETPGLLGLRGILETAEKDEVLVHGIPVGSTPGATYRLVTRQRANPERGTISRTKDYFQYPDGCHVVLFDYDEHAAAPVRIRGPHELMTFLAGNVHPVFSDVGWVSRVSTSSGFKSKTTGAWYREPAGFHLYLAVRGDIVAFREWLKVRLWLAGTGFCRLARPNAHSGVASILERCLLDVLVFSPERIDYVAGATVPHGADFYQDRPAPEVCGGCVLNLDDLPRVTLEERAEYRRLVEREKGTLREAQRAGVVAHIRTAYPRASDEAVQRAVTRRIEQASRGELDSNQPLQFDGGASCVVKDLTRTMHGWTLADPFEPEEGPGKAKFYWNRREWYICSWAHGEKRIYYTTRSAYRQKLAGARPLRTRTITAIPLREVSSWR